MRVYHAYKCDCCGSLIEGDCPCDSNDSAYFIIRGPLNYPRLADEKFVFEDICNKCREDFRQVIENTAIAHGWQPAPLPEPVIRPETPTETMVVEPPTRDVNEGEPF